MIINGKFKILFSQNEKTEIEDIAEAISNALDEEKPIAFTNFEEEQERTAIISIEELMEINNTKSK